MAYIRKTKDYWEIQGLYCHGWEAVTAEETWKDARVQLRCYRDHESNTAFRAVKKRERIATQPAERQVS